MDHIIFALLSPLVFFDGIAGIIVAAGWSKAERIRAMGRAAQPASEAPQETVQAELKSLKHQINEMQSTSHQFDMSFDEALTRLEQRVVRLETKTTIRTQITPDASNVLKNSQRM